MTISTSPKTLPCAFKSLRNNKTPTSVTCCTDMIELYANEGETDDKQWATLADLARHAKAAGLASPELSIDR